jgi:hypothetical protein
VVGNNGDGALYHGYCSQTVVETFQGCILNKEYDLILIITTFRRVMVYLPMIKELSHQFRIGLYNVAIPEKEKIKTQETDRIFVDLCCRFGAEIVEDFPVKSQISIIPQWAYTDEQIRLMRSRIRCERYFVIVGLMWGNLHLDKIEGIPIEKYLVIDMDLYRYRLEKREKEKDYSIDPKDLVEVGLPFARYPVFEDMGLDYMIAHPSPLSLPEAKDKCKYLECLLSLVSEIDPRARIVLKPHNGAERYDYVVNERCFCLLTNSVLYPMHSVILWAAERLMRWVKAVDFSGSRRIQDGLYDVMTAIHYKKLLERVVPFSRLTPYYNFSLELFLPLVKKGLITGRSNTIWHALLLKLPVYNCVDKNTISENKDKMNYYSMQYFEVPYCGGNLVFDEKYFGIIREEVRQRNMIQYLIAVLNKEGALKT